MPSRVSQFTPRLRSGWTGAVLIAVAMLVLWLPDLDLPLGDSDDGRILARYGLQARNYWELGPAESNFGTRVDPYIRGGFEVEPGAEPPTAALTYAHHPPLQVFVTIISFGLLGDSLVALRLAGFVMGASTVVFMAALLRGRGLGWGPTLLAVGAMAATGFYYIYGRLGVGFSLLVAVVALVAYLRDTTRPSRWLLAAAATVAGLAVMQSWIAMAAVGLLVLWLWKAQGRSAALGWVLAGALIGVAVTVAWILNATGPAELGDQVATRTDSSTGSLGDFLSRQWRFAGLLTPVWLRWLMVPALVAGLADRRTRMATAVTLAVAAAWTFGLRQGAWVHALWNFPWLAPVTIGLAALGDATRRWVRGRVALVAGAGAGAVIMVTLFGLVTGSTREDYLSDPAAAATAIERVVEPASGRLWVTPQISSPRWVSYYIDLPVWTLTEHYLDELGVDDLVLVRTDRIPGFLADRIPGDSGPDEIVEGRYRLIPALVLSG